MTCVSSQTVAITDVSRQRKVLRRGTRAEIQRDLLWSLHHRAFNLLYPFPASTYFVPLFSFFHRISGADRVHGGGGWTVMDCFANIKLIDYSLRAYVILYMASAILLFFLIPKVRESRGVRGGMK